MVERTYTLSRRLLLALYGAIGGVIVALVISPETGEEEWTSAFTAFALIGVILTQLIFARPSFRGNVLKGRAQAIEKALSKAGLAIKERHAPTRSQNFRAIAERDSVFHTSLEGDGWCYADHTHAVYDENRHGEAKAATVFYSVLEIDLSRALPNMVFDSQRAHKKQFTPLFDRTQRHSLEGDFDKHFETFFPKHYQIDSLSIITPEVMQAMIAADQFDIELAGDKLYLYGPLVPAKQVPTMIKMGLVVRDKLMNNLTTYRDERLEGEKGRAGVSAFGAQLRDNPYAGWILGLIGLALFVLGIYGAVAETRVTDDASDAIDTAIGGFILMAGTSGMIWYRLRKNKQLDDKYTQKHEQAEPQKAAALTK